MNTTNNAFSLRRILMRIQSSKFFGPIFRAVFTLITGLSTVILALKVAVLGEAATTYGKIVNEEALERNNLDDSVVKVLASNDDEIITNKRR
ncbi:hypothetical protein RN22_09705 [Grimontia sp. AD028]|uniref:hypothetical protein n=1 Tax=Grimontia sp. AD028 TaxID=1581149 RepID=UPI00061AB17A|nr:hypothetical protein [Grimontia sp. AD028]KKD60677.1 hypothetical protein RN22_09705 [Grimontia sp. AD028]